MRASPILESVLTRRTVLQMLGAAGIMAPARKRVLILGGTGFLGPATVEAALARGHQLTLFNRGRTRPGLFPDLEKLTGDRDPRKGEGLKALAGRQWDAAIDNSGYYPRMVGASAKLLAGAVKQYIFISSISVYAQDSEEGADETARVATIPNPAIEEMGPNWENFGALKALCERAAEEAMPGRVTVVRPGYIVGPDDPSGRFTYWPVRVDRRGEILAPGEPADPVQFIDVRDLGAWLVQVVEDGTTGVFNATGPEKRLGMGELLTACQRATPTNGHADLGESGVFGKAAEGGVAHLGGLSGEDQGVPHAQDRAGARGGAAIPAARDNSQRHAGVVQDAGTGRTREACGPHAGAGGDGAGGLAAKGSSRIQRLGRRRSAASCITR